MTPPRIPSLLSLVVGLVLLAGCGGDGGSPDLGDWTLKTNDRSLSKDLEVSESDAFYFGRIFDLDVTSKGQMVVADWDAKNIKVLRPDGTLIDTLGQEGEGPGEFQQLMSVQVARGDSIYTHDVRRSQLTVFAPPPSLELARTITIPREKGFATQVVVLEDRLLASFGTTTPPEDGISRPSPEPWRRIDASGTPGDTVIMTRQRKRAMMSMNGGFRIGPVPFSRRTATAIGPQSRLYHGWTDSLRISAQALNGTSETVASVPTAPLPIQKADRDSALSSLRDNLGSDMTEMIRSALPDTKPAFNQFVVDDKEQLWVERPTKASVSHHRWWILNSTSKTIYEVQVPSEVDLEVAQNGMAYGTTETEMGAPAIVRYRLDSPS
jgi:hypothetical protein